MTNDSPFDRDDLVSVVIVGGGYAGMMTSNRFLGSLTSEERARVRVTIINPSDRFVHRIRLHEHAAGITDAALELRSMIHPEVTVVIGSATSIDRARQVVLVDTAETERPVAYDWLVYAVGSRSASQVPGAARYAVPIGDIDGASDIARRFTATHIRSVCVVGGGPAGVETAAELAEAHLSARVTLLAGHELVAGMRAAARRSIRRRLQRLGVVVEEGVHVAEVAPKAVRTVGGARRPFDLVVWAAGFEVPDLAARSGLPVDQAGRLLVDDTLACITEPTILGAGDAVKAPDAVSAHLPMGARTALPLGGAAADSLLARLRDEEAQPISIGLLGPSISLGRHDGYIQVARPDDSPTPIAVTGRLGAAIKAWVCRMTIDRPRDERTRPGAYRVPDGPKVTQRHRSLTAAAPHLKKLRIQQQHLHTEEENSTVASRLGQQKGTRH